MNLLKNPFNHKGHEVHKGPVKSLLENCWFNVYSNLLENRVVGEN